jgi:hypothetical protein
MGPPDVQSRIEARVESRCHGRWVDHTFVRCFRLPEKKLSDPRQMDEHTGGEGLLAGVRVGNPAVLGANGSS